MYPQQRRRMTMPSERRSSTSMATFPLNGPRARLFAMTRPPLVSDAQWRELMNSVGLFLDCWAATAAELGWTAHEVFGCDPYRPVQRLDQQGLIWQLHGAAIASITAVGAIVRTAAGP